MKWLKKILKPRKPRNLWDRDECPLCYEWTDWDFTWITSSHIIYTKNQLCSKHLKEHDTNNY